MYCAKCGLAVGDQDRECASCGTNLMTFGSLRFTPLDDNEPDEAADSADEAMPESALDDEPEAVDEPPAVEKPRPFVTIEDFEELAEDFSQSRTANLLGIDEQTQPRALMIAVGVLVITLMLVIILAAWMIGAGSRVARLEPAPATVTVTATPS